MAAVSAVVRLIMRLECNRETEGKEETQSAVCKLVWLDPHPVVIMDTCTCSHVCVCVRARACVRACA